MESFKEDDETLITHLPINVSKLETKTNSKELKKLQEENKELREKITSLLNEKNKKVKVIKNNCSNKKHTSKCWWCCGEYDNFIILPDKKINGKYIGEGNYHSFNCALASNFEMRDERIWERYSLLHQMKEEMIPEDTNKINPAPPKEVLKEYGGELSREEYDELLLSVDSSFIKLLPPLVSSTILIEQRNKHGPELTQLNLLGMKLKRTKNPVKNKFSLDNLISIN